MFLYPLAALTTPFPVLMTLFPVNIFYKIEAPKFPNNNKISQEIHLLVTFTVSLTPSINIPGFFSDFMILIMSSKSSFKIIKVVLFLGLTTPTPLVALLPHIFLNSTIYCRHQSN